MPTYFFTIVDAGRYEDPEGYDLPDVEHARATALLEAQDLMTEGQRRGEDRSRWQIEIRDENGTLQSKVPFSELSS